ncbi:TIGR02677 family protein [Acididesulfobacillus acetoxydans]|uniref:TIGR02677 family protein n=1 Tax=Acididesulfobacillus acetoxydans TaxID=1561005 RepID=A0A8S0W367_9FIRM|nr:TIGR02677 family protein [Acididesulfobacillus acetoxydans]CAA7601358.1 TIGR02677 family protein [Acididesulfobacillus acetoxydans]CEJ06023.1 TIGR02677 protein [Acididesulfobacillus acetoxydans]
MDERVLKPIQEATYLTVGNAWRYRSILRYCYRQHERLQHYLLLETIYSHLKTSPYFDDYSEEMLQQDLNQLVAWQNLIPRQETGRVGTIEEFKKRQYRYQLTPYTIEIERMVTGLENLGEGFGGSLERTLFDRLLQGLIRLSGQAERASGYTIFAESDEDIHLAWQDLYQDFRKLTENATDYLAHLQSEKVEEKMMTEAFLVYKEAITEYLRNFMQSLQRTAFRIEGILKDTPPSFGLELAERLTNYELSIPRLDLTPEPAVLKERFLAEWESLKVWFTGDATRESDLLYLQNATNDAVRRLTRFAQRLGENHHHIRSRRTDYLHLAHWFAGLKHLEEAHELSACVFGVFHTRQLLVTRPKETESFEQEVWDVAPVHLTIRPKIRSYHERTKASAVQNRMREKKAACEAYLKEKEAEDRLLRSLMSQERIVIRDLPVVNPAVRKAILYWITKCMANPEHKGKTDAGEVFRLHLASSRRIRLQADDGSLEMPDYVLEFESALEAAR